MTCILKLCPFCGGPGEMVAKQYADEDATKEGWSQTEFHVVTCTACGAEAGGPEPGKKTEMEAAAAWNRRTAGTH